MAPVRRLQVAATPQMWYRESLQDNDSDVGRYAGTDQGLRQLGDQVPVAECPRSR